MAGGCPRKAGTGFRATTDFLTWSERDAIRKEVFARDLPLCVWCHAPLGDHRSESYYTADHIVARSAGGAYIPDNLALACKPCNNDRGGLSLVQYLFKRATRSDALPSSREAA